MKTKIIENIVKILIPLIQVFGIYVILFGHISPGGGFAGGSILGSSIILFRFVYGSEHTDKKYPYKYLMRTVSIALIMYGSLKGMLFILDHFGIDKIIPVGVPNTFLSGGSIIPLNIMIGLVVTITFYFIAILFEEGELEYEHASE
ncbi:MAG: MnhB domain-containing protein [Clostridiales bacterium]|nr:MnhB domain-containing protein [Clostridiales bacterium]